MTIDAPNNSAKVKFEVNYYNGCSGHKVWSHQYVEEWESLPNLYCPNCGKREVWHETNPGDYYLGERYLCASCKHAFYLPMHPCDDSNDEQGCQRLAHILPKSKHP